MTIAGPLRECAEAAGGTVRALAKEWEVSTATIYRWWRGDILPEPLTRRAVNEWAKAHGCRPPFAKNAKRRPNPAADGHRLGPKGPNQGRRRR